jgi:hypothetical protein
MSPRIIDCEQGSADWYAARLGLPTASMFKVVMRDGADSKTRSEYLRKLAGELLTGDPMESYTNQHMERGKDMEDEARALYAFVTGMTPHRVGFIVNGDTGCSPDSLIGTDGGLEIKTAAPHILIGHIIKGTFPAEHRAQCQGNMWVADRQWWDLMIYWPKMTPFVIRAQRDSDYIATLAGAVKDFNAELHDIVARVREYQGERAAA